jgi:prolyl-tRNA synthetase
LRGVPLRVELGPKDIEKSAVPVARRDTREKQSVPMDGLAGRLAICRRDRRTSSNAPCSFAPSTPNAWRPTTSSAGAEGRPGFVIAPWCGLSCEAQIKTDTQATIRNMPLNDTAPPGNCVRCDNPATAEAWFAKSY